MKFKFLYLIGLAMATAPMLQSCSDDDDSSLNSYTALVTVVPVSDNSFEMNLTNTVKLIPTNLKASPFKDKEVRALVNYTYDEIYTEGNNNVSSYLRNVSINWIDSIRTKMPVLDKGVDNDALYGKDCIEIVKDWVTIAEDGYLTLRVRTKWGSPGVKHEVNLLSGGNPEDPYEFELRHNANGDTFGEIGDALIAFNLNQLITTSDPVIKIKIKWESFSGPKSTEFDLTTRNSTIDDAQAIRFSGSIK